MLSQSTVAASVLAGIMCLQCLGPTLAETSNPSPVQTRPVQTKPPSTVERPFGGPPNRTRPIYGTACTTGAVTCVLANPREMGSRCACKAKGGRHLHGKVVPSN